VVSAAVAPNMPPCLKSASMHGIRSQAAKQPPSGCVLSQCSGSSLLLSRRAMLLSCGHSSSCHKASSSLNKQQHQAKPSNSSQHRQPAATMALEEAGRDASLSGPTMANHAGECASLARTKEQISGNRSGSSSGTSSSHDHVACWSRCHLHPHHL